MVVSFIMIIERIHKHIMDGDLNAADQASAMYWTHCKDLLQTLPYHQVSTFDRAKYTVAACIRAHTLIARDLDIDTLKEALKVLDLCIIVAGAPVLRNLIDDLINHILVLIDAHMEKAIQPGLRLTDETCKKTRQWQHQRIHTHARLIPEHPESFATDLDWFMTHQAHENTPFIIRDAASDWPASLSNNQDQSLWNSVDYWLSHIHPYRTVPIEIGKMYTDDSWTQSLTSFQSFLLDHLFSDTETAYLAQYDLFRQFPALKKDFYVPDLCFVKDSANPPIENVWIGPQNTISPFHQVPYDNTFIQVIGYKYFCLVEEKNKHILFKDDLGLDTIMVNTSIVHPNDVPDELKMEGIVGPGDCLYIPVSHFTHLRYIHSLEKQTH